MIDVKACPGFVTPLGRVGENNSRRIVFDVSWLSDFPGADLILYNRRVMGEDSYPVFPEQLENIDGKLYWTVSSADVAGEGSGKCEIAAYLNGTIVKSEIYHTVCLAALDERKEPPAPWISWQRQLVSLAHDAEEAANAASQSEQAAETAKHAAETAGESATEDAGRAEESARNAALDAERAEQAKTAAQAAQEAAEAAEQSVVTKAATAIQTIETKGAEQVVAVTASGQHQVAAVEQKGEQVRQSIPSDYTELSEDVTGLKSTVNTLEEDAFKISAGSAVTADSSANGERWNYVNGDYIKGTTGTAQYWNNKKYTVQENTYYIVTGCYMTTAPMVIFVDANNNFIGNSGLITISGNYVREAITIKTPIGTASIIVQNFGTSDVYPNVKNCVVTSTFDDKLKTSLGAEYVLPVKWRQGTITNGEMYFTLYGCCTDLVIPTSICTYIKVLAATHTLSVNYYNMVKGVLTFVKKVNFSADYTIEKTYDYFAANIFKSFNEQTLIDQCDSIVELRTVLPCEKFSESIIKAGCRNHYANNMKDMWSLSHQGYSPDGANHNKRGGYSLAAQRGFSHGETDVILTSDGVPVCCHDATFVDATTGETITIANETYEDLITFDYYGDTIASLEEIIAECKRCGLKLELDHMTSDSVSAVTNVVSKLAAWDTCFFAVTYRNENPTLATATVSAIRQINANAQFIINFNGFADYTDVVAFVKSLPNATLALGQYLDANLNALKQITASLQGGARMIVWTVDNIARIKSVLPYINGWCSNAISGMDIMNPTYSNGLKLN